MKTLLHPITTEKAIRAIEIENKMEFVVDSRMNKAQIKDEIEKKFNAKVDKINTQIRNNKKIAIVKLKAETPAIDIATKLGMI